MIFKHFSFLVMFLYAAVGCSDLKSAVNGKRAKQVSRPEPQLFANNFDSVQVGDNFGGKNPIGSLQVGNSLSLGFCTTFLADDGLFFTNAHCIEDLLNGETDLSDTRILMKNPGEGEEFVMVTSIVKYRDGLKYGDAYVDAVDWAALQPEDSTYLLAKYGSLSFHKKLLPFEVLKNNIEVQIFAVNPPDSLEGTLLLEVKGGKANTAEIYSRIKTSIEKDGEKDAAKIEISIKSMLQIYPYVWIDNANVINGNSGSPVLFEGKVIGIVSHRAASNRVLMQWIYNINREFGYTESFLTTEMDDQLIGF